MLVWICIIAFYSIYGGAAQTSLVIDNLKTQADCQRISTIVISQNNRRPDYPPSAVCVQVSKVR